MADIKEKAMKADVIDQEAGIRSQEDIVRRALALMVVAGKAVAGHDVGRILMERSSVQGFLSPVEAEFMCDLNPEQAARAYFSWRYECLHVMLWALGIITELGQPTAICDVAFIDATMVELEGRGLREKAALRPSGELLAAADALEYAHWRVRDAQIFARPIPDGINPDVVYERHYAINWLTGDEDWDEVSTDT